MDGISVRYIVDDVDAAAAFYADVLGFRIEMRPGPGFAMLQHGPLRLLLNSPGAGGGAGQTLSDGARPSPAAGTASSSRSTTSARHWRTPATPGADVRGDVIEGRGGRQALLVDPSGNLVELFEAY